MKNNLKKIELGSDAAQNDNRTDLGYGNTKKAFCSFVDVFFYVFIRVDYKRRNRKKIYKKKSFTN